MTQVITADLCDNADNNVRVARPILSAFGGKPDIAGPVLTLRVFEDNSLVREALAEDGAGRVLVVDGGGSTRCALLGGNLASMALQNGWAGIVIHGSVRDRLEIDALPLAVRALSTVPRRSDKRDSGEKDVELHFAGIDIRPGDYLYADVDGIIVADRDLLDRGA